MFFNIFCTFFSDGFARHGKNGYIRKILYVVSPLTGRLTLPNLRKSNTIIEHELPEI